MLARKLLHSVGGDESIGAVDFDGTGDYMNFGQFSGAPSSTNQGILSFWARIDGGASNVRQMMGSNNVTGHYTYTRLTAGNVFQFVIGHPSGSGGIAINVTSGSTTYGVGASWRHFLLTWRLSDATGAVLYVDDSNVTLTQISKTNVSSNYNTMTAWRIADAAIAPGGEWNGALAEFYYAPGQWLDISQASNRAKFNNSGAAVWLGALGARPTGVQPEVYHHITAAETVPSNFANGKGVQASWTMNGNPTIASTFP